MDIETRLTDTDTALPEPPAPVDNLVRGVVFDDILHVPRTHRTIKDDMEVECIPKPAKLGVESTVDDEDGSARLVVLPAVGGG